MLEKEPVKTRAYHSVHHEKEDYIRNRDTAVTKMATYHANTSQRLFAVMPDFKRTTSPGLFISLSGQKDGKDARIKSSQERFLMKLQTSDTL